MCCLHGRNDVTGREEGDDTLIHTGSTWRGWVATCWLEFHPVNLSPEPPRLEPGSFSTSSVRTLGNSAPHCQLPDFLTSLTARLPRPVPQKNLLPRPPGGRDVTVIGSCVSNKIALLVLRRGQTGRWPAPAPAPAALQALPVRPVLFLAPSRHTIHRALPLAVANRQPGHRHTGSTTPQPPPPVLPDLASRWVLQVAPDGVAMPNGVETTRRRGRRCGAPSIGYEHGSVLRFTLHC